MRYAAIVLTLLLGSGSLLLEGAGQAAQPGQPRLVVMLVVDSLRAEFITTLSPHWRSGFKTLLAEGAWFRQVQIPYLHSDTCAGHATLSTGTLPRRHGMVADNWWDADLKEDLECTRDSSAKTITYGRPARIGNSPKWLRSPTVADRLREQRPGARVVTLSLKGRSAIGLAGQAADAIAWFEDAAGAFVTSSAFSAGPVGALKQAIDASPYEKALDSTWTLRDAPGTYRNKDAGIGERPPVGWTGLFPHTLKGEKGADDRFASQWRRSPMADAYLGYLATQLVDAYKLGQGTTTDYLGVSFSAVDYIAHAFGPDSLEAEDATIRIDDVVGALIAHLDAKVGRGNYMLALAADHGIAPVPSAGSSTGRVAPEDIRERIEDTLRSRNRAPLDGPYLDSNYRGSMYLSPGGRQRVMSDPGAVRAVQDAVMAIPGVERVLYGPSLTEQSSDALVKAAWASRAQGRSGDFVVTLKRNWMLTTRGSPSTVDHGSFHDYDRRVPLLLLGAGVRRGTYDVPASSVDVAPTLAALAGLSLPDVDGRILREAILPAVPSPR